MACVLNRFRDGWAKVGLTKTVCQSGMVVQSEVLQKLKITFHTPVAKHLAGRGIVAVGDMLHKLDVSSGSQTLEINCNPGRTAIYIESDGYMKPSDHLGSPNDHREIGLRWEHEFVS